jgi:serine phosphatase RsbU (regulator of sigma subunit)
VSLLVDALAALAGADDAAGVAQACLPLLMAQPGVRACALVERHGDQAVVAASAGYDCTSMSAGVALPLDAGLPVTEAVRTGRLVVQGVGPSWMALPFGRRRSGALLLSLTVAPPESTEELARLHRLARALGEALHAAGQRAQAVVDMDLVHARLAPPCLASPDHDLAVRRLPYDGPVSGDVAVCEPDPRGGLWLVMADVCGAGLAAGLAGRSVGTAVAAVAGYAEGPAELLAAVERALRADIPAGSFVTALAVHLDGEELRIACAGHPAPLLLTANGAASVSVEPGEPLALETGTGGPRPSTTAVLPRDALLLLHTDGLTDRRTASGTRSVDPLDLVPADRAGDLEDLAERVLAAAEAVGPAGDDVSLLLVRRRQ